VASPEGTSRVDDVVDVEARRGASYDVDGIRALRAVRVIDRERCGAVRILRHRCAHRYGYDIAQRAGVRPELEHRSSSHGARRRSWGRCRLGGAGGQDHHRDKPEAEPMNANGTGGPHFPGSWSAWAHSSITHDGPPNPFGPDRSPGAAVNIRVLEERQARHRLRPEKLRCRMRARPIVWTRRVSVAGTSYSCDRQPR
jgi:hypothetical protein